MNVLIADNYELFREGLKKMLLKISNGEINEIREVSHANELMAALANKTDILFLNLNISGGEGLEILKNIRLLHPQIPILVLSVRSESKVAVRVLKAGASGFFQNPAHQKIFRMLSGLLCIRKKIRKSVNCRPDSSLL